MTQRFGALTTRDAVHACPPQRPRARDRLPAGRHERLRTVLEDVTWSAGQHEEAPGGTWEADQLAGIAQWLEGIISLYTEDERGRGNAGTF